MINMQLIRKVALFIGLLPCVAYSANVSIQGLGNLQNTYQFPAISLMTFKSTDERTASPLSFVIDDFATNIQLSLTANHSDGNNTWMEDPANPSQKIDYEVIYTTCNNGSVQATANLSKNLGTDGVSCVNHSCTIPNEFANSFVCTAGAGGEGHLTIKRMDLSEMPESADYSGTLQLTVSESP